MKITRRAAVLLVGVVAAALVAVAAGNVGPAYGAPEFPQSFTQTTLTNALSDPHDMEFAPDNSGRVFVAQQGGAVRILHPDGRLSTFHDISGQVYQQNSMGLIGITFDPQFSTNRFVYLFYTHQAEGAVPIHNRIIRVTANASGDSVVPGSERLLLRLPDLLDNGLHNGGSMRFGADGKLYATVGENNRRTPAQSLDSLFGKIVRINRDGTIPTDNPFYSTAAGDNRAIWARGLRNPFRMAIRRGTGTMFVNDVGGATWEEINRGAAGANFGWPVHEGEANNPPYTDPDFAYPHDGVGNPAPNTSGCAIAGGTFYDPATLQFPAEYEGDYFFADWCNGWIRRYDPATDQTSLFATGVEHAIDMEVGGDGSLYVLRRGQSVNRIQYTGASNRPPNAVLAANRTSGPVPLTVDFDGSGSNDPDAGDTLTYLWDFGDGSATQTTSSPTTSHAYSSAGTYTASLRVRDSRGAISVPDTARIDAGNEAPSPTIGSPSTGLRFRVGQQVTLGGSATDPEDGQLPASSLEWEVLLHHNNSHTHPYFSGTGTNLTMTTPAPEDLMATGPGNFLELRLTATDSAGVSRTVSQELQPNRVDVALGSSPGGLSLQVNGETITAPRTLISWEGYELNQNAPSPQALSGRSYSFASWSDGGARQHTVVTGTAPSTYTATFTESGADTVAPRVASTSPNANATGVGRGANVTAVFSEKMDPATVSASTLRLFTVNANGTTTRVTDAPVSVSPDGLQATLNPFGTSTQLLAQNARYKVVVTTGAKDAAGNPLDQKAATPGNQQKGWFFTTGTA